MPYVHTYPFSVRHFECDVYGRVQCANYLRYMQESAFAASSAVGFPPERYESLGLQWLAYETDIEYYKPLHYGDAVQIKTWVEDFRRVRSLRAYEFYRNSDLIARAFTDWVLFDAVELRPATITPEIIEAYARGEDVSPAPPRKPLPQIAKPESSFTMQRHVVWSEIDPAMHVNNAVYLNYVIDCGVQFLASQGWTPARLHDFGVDVVSRHSQIEYKIAAQMDEVLEIAAWFGQMDVDGGMRYFTITRMQDSKMICRVRDQWAWLDRGSGQPMPIADEFRQAFA